MTTTASTLGTVTATEPTSSTMLKAGAKTEPASLAGAISGLLRTQGYADVQAIGAGAVNQTVKAVAVARGYFASQAKDLNMVPSFLDTMIEGVEKTVIRFRVNLVDR